MFASATLHARLKTPEKTRSENAAYMREWLRKNPAQAQKNRARAVKWQRDNKERRRLYMEKYYAANREKFLKKTRDWDKANPERAKALAVDYSARRRGKLRGMDKGAAVLVKRMVEREARKKVHRCYYCKKSFRGSFHFDHVVPLASSGKHEIANMAVSCPACNCSKQDKLVGSLVVNGQKLLNL